MHLRHLLLLAALLAAYAAPARADEEFDVSVSGDTVTLTAKGGWKVNAKAAWKLVGYRKTVAKSAFKFTDTTAIAAKVPGGTWTLRGELVNADGGQAPLRVATTFAVTGAAKK